MMMMLLFSVSLSLHPWLKMEEDDVTSCNNNYPNYHKPNQKDIAPLHPWNVGILEKHSFRTFPIVLTLLGIPSMHLQNSTDFIIKEQIQGQMSFIVDTHYLDHHPRVKLEVWKHPNLKVIFLELVTIPT